MTNKLAVRMNHWAETLVSARGVGHTMLLLEGLKTYQGRVLLVAKTREMADLIAREAKLANPDIQIETRGLDDSRPLRGARVPVAWDNSALLYLFMECGAELRELNRIVDSLEKNGHIIT